MHIKQRVIKIHFVNIFVIKYGDACLVFAFYFSSVEGKWDAVVKTLLSRRQEKGEDQQLSLPPSRKTLLPLLLLSAQGRPHRCPGHSTGWVPPVGKLLSLL